MKKTKIKWQTRSYINNKPIEEYTREEVNTFFHNAWIKGFKAIGYITQIDKNLLKHYQQEALKHKVILEIIEEKVIYKRRDKHE